MVEVAYMMLGSCIEVVWRLLEVAWRLPGGCPEVAWRLPGGGLEVAADFKHRHKTK